MTTIVTCVESGPLEAQVLMLAETLRAFGGSWAKSDFVAVKPRRGPSISAHTRRELKRLSVEFIDENMNAELSWWNNANKSATIAKLEGRVSTRNVTWMDSDLVVLNPLDDLLPSPGTQFVARAGEGYLGSDGDDENADYWRVVCKLVGLRLEDFKMINSFPEGRPIRAYWQGGIFTYDKSTRLGSMHFEMLRKLMSTDIGSKASGVYHQDQVSFALACQKLQLDHSEYHPSMNFNLTPLADEYARLIPVRDVRILHYHGSFYASDLGWAMQFLEQLPKDRVEVISKYLPLSANATLLARLYRKFLGKLRQSRADRFTKRARLY